MRSVKVLLAVALVLGFCSIVNADVVFSTLGNTNTSSEQAAQFKGSWDGGAIADDFTLSGATTVTKVQFMGHFEDGNSANKPYPVGLRVEIYSDNGGAPGTLLATRSVRDTVGDGIAPIGTDLYEIDFTADPLSLAGGTYWIRPQGELRFQPDYMTYDSFKVMWANDTAHPSEYTPAGAAAVTYNGGVSGSWGREWHEDWMSGNAYRYGTSYTEQKLDLAFAVVASVPEPASIVLVCMGLVGLLAYAWRKRK